MKKNKHIHLYWVLLASNFAMVSCASQRPPSGGPPDQTPPQIVSITPENNSTLVPQDQLIEFEFSEGMDRKSLAKAVFVTPDPGEGRVEYKWKGPRLRVEFEDSLKSNRTYVITLGTDLKDSHGNPMKDSYTLAFSTGAEISKGKIAGQVHSKEKAQGILVWAYILASDDPDPRQRPGDYATQTNAQGKFELTNLSDGTYRVFAIKDNDNNRFFEVGVDALGIPSLDIALSADELSYEGLNFRVALTDTIGPGLVSVSAQNHSQLTLRFDEAMQKLGTDIVQNFKIYPLKSPDDSVDVLLAYLKETDPLEVALAIAPLTAKTEYEIEVRNLADVSGNLIDAAYSKAQFVASALSDTMPAAIAATTPIDSARAVPLNTIVNIHFSEAVNPAPLERNVFVADSVGSRVNGTFQWLTPASVKFKPEFHLQSLSAYRILVKLDSLIDRSGNALRDSTWQLFFTTLSADTLSSISGAVIDEDSTATAAIYLTAVSTERNGPAYDLVLPAPGPYLFSDILPGAYTIEAFRDRNENGEYDFGKAVPFQPAERFAIHSENIQVRSRWPNEGNNIVFRSK